MTVDAEQVVNRLLDERDRLITALAERDAEVGRLLKGTYGIRSEVIGDVEDTRPWRTIWRVYHYKAIAMGSPVGPSYATEEEAKIALVTLASPAPEPDDPDTSNGPHEGV